MHDHELLNRSFASERSAFQYDELSKYIYADPRVLCPLTAVICIILFNMPQPPLSLEKYLSATLPPVKENFPAGTFLRMYGHTQCNPDAELI